MLLSSWGSNLQTRAKGPMRQTPGCPPSGVLRDKGAFLNELLGKEQKDRTEDGEGSGEREGKGGRAGEKVCSETLSPGRATGWLDTGRRRLHTWVTFLDLELFRKS